MCSWVEALLLEWHDVGVVKTSLNSSDGINVQLDFGSYWFMRAPHFNQSEIKSIVLNIQKGLIVCVSVTSVKMCVGEKTYQNRTNTEENKFDVLIQLQILL